ncbi:reverse transcriptase domain-containing protein [Spiroplasma endosymbiont of Dioctria linearis]|uniref:reverse transcriptase domain-containing protein n=1 Tax=Spiroplasma endosymbiont of Dioctria linearis TaxID=3066290 RepID=UPI00313B507B
MINIFRKWNIDLLSPILLFGADIRVDDKRNLLVKKLREFPEFKNSFFLIPDNIEWKRIQEKLEFNLEEQESLMIQLARLIICFDDTDATSMEKMLSTLISKEKKIIYIKNKDYNNESEFSNIVMKEKYFVIENKFKKIKNNIKKTKKNTLFWTSLYKNDNNNRQLFYNIRKMDKTIRLNNNLTYMFFKDKKREEKHDFNSQNIKYNIDYENKVINVEIPYRQFFNIILCIIASYNTKKISKSTICKDILDEFNLEALQTIKWLSSRHKHKNRREVLIEDLLIDFRVKTKLNIVNKLCIPYKYIEFTLEILNLLEIISLDNDILELENSVYNNLLQNSLILKKDFYKMKITNFKKQISEISDLIELKDLNYLILKKIKFWCSFRIYRNLKFRQIYTYKKEFKYYKEYHNFFEIIFNSQYLFNKKSIFIDNLFSYRENKNYIQMLEKHVDNSSEYFLTIDIKKYFDSIDINILSKMIWKKLNKILWFEDIKKIVKHFCIKNRGLKIGFSCSPFLSNLYLTDFDEQILKECKKEELIYTRYADDILISSKIEIDQKSILEIISSKFEKLKLEINKVKQKSIDINKNNFKYMGATFIKNNNKIILKKPNSYFNKIKQIFRNDFDYKKLVGMIQHSFLINSENSLKQINNIFKKEFKNEEDIILFLKEYNKNYKK